MQGGPGGRRRRPARQAVPPAAAAAAAQPPPPSRLPAPAPPLALAPLHSHRASAAAGEARGRGSRAIAPTQSTQRHQRVISRARPALAALAACPLSPQTHPAPAIKMQRAMVQTQALFGKGKATTTGLPAVPPRLPTSRFSINLLSRTQLLPLSPAATCRCT